MNLNCISGIFSFCRPKKKRKADSKEVDKEEFEKEESDTNEIQNNTFVSNSGDSEQQEENLDIIDSYSKSENDNRKIKKSVQLDKCNLKKEITSFADIKKTNKSKDYYFKEIPKKKVSKKAESSCSSEINKEEHKKKPSKNRANKPESSCSSEIHKEEQKIKVSKNTTKNINKPIEELSESIKNLNTKKKPHKLTKLKEKIKEFEDKSIADDKGKVDEKNTADEKPFRIKKTQNECVESSKQSIEDEDDFYSTSVSMSSQIEHRNILTDSDMNKIRRKENPTIDSDSEICFLKNKSENTKFNHNLKKKLLEYLIRKDTK
ncbi:hypothetical protein NGRA_0630 [Nosema granulosis]|uniref:Uncharacterized protein n=1 Tax=Nosema granulosis TaxID=83296 RepID=A0A9P6H008_9MICR|nr:hypothetical protein NGRA_0630 [Nosema granulosis]